MEKKTDNKTRDQTSERLTSETMDPLLECYVLQLVLNKRNVLNNFVAYIFFSRKTVLKNSQSTKPVVYQMNDENSSNSDDETSANEETTQRDEQVEGGNQILLGQLRQIP